MCASFSFSVFRLTSVEWSAFREQQRVLAEQRAAGHDEFMRRVDAATRRWWDEDVSYTSACMAIGAVMVDSTPH